MPVKPQPLPGTRFGLVADAHIHPGKSPPFPERLATAFAGADAIIALGDLGEAAGLDWLQATAPVVGVLGDDDVRDDARVAGDVRLFEIGGLRVGALFDGMKQGLFAANDPLQVRGDFVATTDRLFGARPDVLLCGATHKSRLAMAYGTLIIDPGSPTLSDAPSVALLHINSGVARVEQIRI